MGSTKQYTEASGRRCTVYYDDRGFETGHSYEDTDMRGGVVLQNYNAKNSYTGYSRVGTDIQNNTYYDNYDEKGLYTGRTKITERVNGDRVYEYYDTKGLYLGKRVDSFSPDVQRSTAAGQSPGGSGSGAGGGVGMLIFGVLLISAAVCFLSRNYMVVAAGVRGFIGVCLCPLVSLILQLSNRKNLGSDPAQRQLYKKLAVGSAVLMLALQLIFLLYTDPAAEEGTPARSFILFLLCWIPKLIYSIAAGGALAAACRASANAGDCKEMAYDFHRGTAIAFGITTGIMEFLNALAGEPFNEIIGAIIYSIPAIAVLTGVILLLNKLTGIPFSSRLNRL